MIYDMRCENGHQTEQFVHTPSDYGSRTIVCQCGATMERILSLGQGLCYFEEGRGRWIHNLGVDPIYITTPAQHREAMKRTERIWATAGQGRKGCWV